MTADTIGGVWTYALELARALQPYGADVVLATMGNLPSPSQLDEADSITNIRLRVSDYKLEWMEDPWSDVERAGEWLQRLEYIEKPDIVHLNGYAHAALYWRAPCVVVGHSCVLSWWEAVKGEAAPLSWNRYKGEVKKGLQAAQLVLAPTGAMLSALSRHYGSLGATYVVPNGREAKLFLPGEKEPFILSVGRAWDEAKNVAALEKASPKLKWPVYLAGDDKHPDNARKMQLSNVRNLGKLGPDELPGWYGRASIYALPAKYEPFGLSALEAGLAGCALVLGDIASLREVWRDAALFVPPDDVDLLTKTINRLVANPDLLAEMAGRARLRAAHFTPEHMAEEYVSAISAYLPNTAESGVYKRGLTLEDSNVLPLDSVGLEPRQRSSPAMGGK